MKNLRLICLMVIILTIVGCNEDADEFPIDLVGIWEMEGFNDDIELNYVHTYIFNWDGTFQKSITLREEDGVEDLGYISNLSGSFRTDGNTLILSNLKFWNKPHGGLELAVPMDELLEPGSLTDTSTHFALQNNDTQLYFNNGCVEDMCQVPETYLKVM